MVPTRTPHSDEIVLRVDYVDVVFEGLIFDVPGSSPEDVLKIMQQPHKNKILLLVLAHTKSFDNSEIDWTLINEQLEDVQRLWVRVIGGLKAQLNKVVIFINKTDLLPSEYLPAQKQIYEEHIKLLYSAAEKEHIRLTIVEGSSTYGTNLRELYEKLRPTVLRKETPDETQE